MYKAVFNRTGGMRSRFVHDKPSNRKKNHVYVVLMYKLFSAISIRLDDYTHGKRVQTRNRFVRQATFYLVRHGTCYDLQKPSGWRPRRPLRRYGKTTRRHPVLCARRRDSNTWRDTRFALFRLGPSSGHLAFSRSVGGRRGNN